MSTEKETAMVFPDARTGVPAASEGIAACDLTNGRLLHELEQVHRTRHETFMYGSDDALRHHTGRTAELEEEYLRRFPDRLVTAGRTRSGARARDAIAHAEATPH